MSILFLGLHKPISFNLSHRYGFSFTQGFDWLFGNMSQPVLRLILVCDTEWIQWDNAPFLLQRCFSHEAKYIGWVLGVEKSQLSKRSPQTLTIRLSTKTRKHLMGEGVSGTAGSSFWFQKNSHSRWNTERSGLDPKIIWGWGGGGGCYFSRIWENAFTNFEFFFPKTLFCNKIKVTWMVVSDALLT